MEKISSRKNKLITHIKALSTDRAYRRLHGEYVCDGMKQFTEAVKSGAEITASLWCSEQQTGIPGGCPAHIVESKLLEYVSPLKNTQGPVFTVRIPAQTVLETVNRIIVLDGVQDPGNVGTVIRTADAFSVSAVILTGACADPFNAKTVRASMGALFRQPVLEMDKRELQMYLDTENMPLYGAALSDTAQDIRKIDMTRAAVAIGSEGMGLSQEILSICTGKVTIPISAQSESLNAAIAASIIMWEMLR